MSNLPPPHWDTPGEVPRLDAGALYHRLEWAIRQLEHWGVKIPPGCRARNALRLLEQLHSANVRGEVAKVRTDPATVLAQHRTALELFLIVYAATHSQYPDHPFTRKKLEVVVRGSDRIEGRDTEPRNKQFELSVAARFRLGGILVFDGEPDLRFQIGRERWGVAAKRVTSGNDDQIKERLKKAVEQIEGQRLPGIIAVNLEGRLETLSEGADEAQWLTEVDAIFDVIFKYSQHYMNSYDVRGVLVYSELTRPLGSATRNGFPAIDMFRPWRFTRLYAPWDDQRGGEAFWSQWQANLRQQLVHCLTDPPAEVTHEPVS